MLVEGPVEIPPQIAITRRSATWSSSSYYAGQVRQCLKKYSGDDDSAIIGLFGIATSPHENQRPSADQRRRQIVAVPFFSAPVIFPSNRSSKTIRFASSVVTQMAFYRFLKPSERRSRRCCRRVKLLDGHRRAAVIHHSNLHHFKRDSSKELFRCSGRTAPASHSALTSPDFSRPESGGRFPLKVRSPFLLNAV